jgi:subtilisin family serine protease
VKNFKGLICTVLLVLLSVQAQVLARSVSVTAGDKTEQRYIVVLGDPPLSGYEGDDLHTPERDADLTRLPSTAGRFTAAGKLDVNSPESKQYLQFLDERFESFRGEALLKLGRQLKSVHRYRNALNGFATDLNVAEARALRAMPRVRSVEVDEIQHLQSDSGPTWIGADKIHSGSAGFPAKGGEGVVIGIFDTGINWDHPSFADPGEGLPPGNGWDHVNPYGSQLGLCSDTQVLCNDKLVGVYDFVEDDPGTEAIEEWNNGKDNYFHGSLSASIAAGNPFNVTFNGLPTVMAGVAPNANIVSYRVCHIGDPEDSDDDGCRNSAILAAIDQALTDGVDVVNHSIGGTDGNPWNSLGTTPGFLTLRNAGIFVATSAGNSGPDPGTVGSPGNAPWVTTVGAATHDRVIASILENLSGGDTTPPGDLIGVSSTIEGIGVTKIVHARNYGNALCGEGEAELGSLCANNNGLSNPFAPGTFNGEIVVCDRGTYGRVEKGKNVKLAGAGGMVLANTESSPQQLSLSDLCLPSTHIDLEDGNQLRSWLDSGIGHQGSISGSSVFKIPEAGDVLADFSARGPNLPPVEEVMKPDIIAPGVTILGASVEGSDITTANGTSFSSPHVAGGAALIKSVHPGWSPTMIASALVMTATPEQAVDYDDSPATVHKRGAGRPRLDLAVNAGLYLEETGDNFAKADPRRNGDPRNLNLPGLIDTACGGSCAFQRTVTDLAGGASWSASAEGFTNGVAVSITPNNFSLADDSSQALSIVVDLSHSLAFKSWIYGDIRLSSAGLPDAVFPLAVFADLPLEWQIDSEDISGSQQFTLAGLPAMPDATFTTAGLVVPTETTETLPVDPRPEPIDRDPYDTNTSVMTVLQNVPSEALWLHTETLASSSEDLDLFVGLDRNGDGKAQESEELCSSTSETDIELCDLFAPVAGDYWIMVHNFGSHIFQPGSQDEITLISAVVGKDTNSRLIASGSGIVPAGEDQVVRLSWDNVSAVPGTELLGAIGIGTDRDNPNNIGIIPVRFIKTGIANPETLVLMNGINRGLTIGAGSTHDRVFVDIPPGTDSLTISASVNGADTELNDLLNMELYRVNFDEAFTDAPFVAAPDVSAGALASASGTVDNGPTLTLSGSNAVPGRWYVVLKNNSSEHADVDVRADMSFSGIPIPLRSGLWQASSRPDINQGIDYAGTTGGYRAFLWYTYDEDGSPAWYVAAGLEPVGNVWVAELLRVTNDGSLQQEKPVGHVSVTLLAEEDSIFSFVLFGEEGSDRAFPSLPPGCPTVDDSEKSYNGTWSRAAVGVGGATVVVNGTSQAFVHYIFDDRGRPVWLIGTPEPQSPTEVLSSLMQRGGYCAVCAEDELTIDSVGLFTRDFTSEETMTWNLDYVLLSPLSGSVNRTDVTTKLTSQVACE